MKLNDNLGFIEGHFLLESKDKLNNIEVLVDNKNTIVNNSFNMLSKLITGQGSDFINKIQLGSGGVYDGTLYAPTKKDSKLYAPTWDSIGWDEIQINNTTEKSITFIKILDFNTGNGVGVSIYSEAGLFANNIMFARKTFSEQLKTSEREFTIKWTIIFKH